MNIKIRTVNNVSCSLFQTLLGPSRWQLWYIPKYLYSIQKCRSEVYIIDDRDYFKTYRDVYPDVYIGPAGLIPAKEDYYYSYGQKTDFMLIKDFDEFYTWYAKGWTQEQIQTEYKKRDKETA